MPVRPMLGRCKTIWASSRGANAYVASFATMASAARAVSTGMMMIAIVIAIVTDANSGTVIGTATSIGVGTAEAVPAWAGQGLRLTPASTDPHRRK
jgi:hypothetical protein